MKLKSSKALQAEDITAGVNRRLVKVQVEQVVHQAVQVDRVALQSLRSSSASLTAWLNRLSSQ